MGTVGTPRDKTVHRLALSVVILPLRWLLSEYTRPFEMCSGYRILGRLARFAQRPVTIAFAESLHRLPLPEYCRALVKGVTALLGESDPIFFDELRAKVVDS